MNIEFYLLSIPCHFHNQPFHVHYMPSSSFTIHTPSHSCIFIHLMPLYNNPIKYMPNIQEQRKYQTRTHSRSASSLRLKGLAQARRSLAQASSLRLGESSTHKNNDFCAFSLRRDSPRLSETLSRSKQSWSPERQLM